MIKYNMVKFIENIDTDNIKISYDKVGIGGFPFAWKINFLGLKITSIEKDGLDEILIDCVSFKYYFYKVKISLSDKIYFSDSKNPDQTQEHKIFASKKHDIFINFDVPVFRVKYNDVLKNIKSLELNIPTTKYWAGDNLMMEIIQLDVALNKIILLNKETFKIKAAMDAQNIGSEDTNLHFTLDLNYVMPVEEDAANEYDYRIAINKFLIKYSDSMLNLSGAVNFKKDIKPEGKLKILAKNYHQLIDEMLPENFIISKSEVKDFIDTNSKYESDKELLYFNIIFTPNGIETGSKKTTVSI